MLALVAAQPQWRAALTDADAGAQVALSIRRAWAGAPDLAWVSRHGRVVVAGGDLRAGDDMTGRRWFDEAVRGPLLGDEQADVKTVLRAVQPLRRSCARRCWWITAWPLRWHMRCSARRDALREWRCGSPGPTSTVLRRNATTPRSSTRCS